MRLQSHIWVSGFIRAQRARDGFATVMRKGAPEAGAIFVVHNRLDGSFDLYAPAPVALWREDDDPSRRFERVCSATDEAAVTEYLDRQSSFDPDCWIVEIERRGEGLDLPLANSGD